MKNIWLMMILGIILLSSCSENTSDMRYEKSNFYVSCLLETQNYIAGEQALKLGTTMDIENAQWDMMPERTAQVTVTEFTSEGVESNFLELEWEEESRGYVDKASVMQIQAKYCYHLCIETISGEVLEAETTVPKTINVLGDSEIASIPAWGFTEPVNDWQTLVLETADSEHPLQVATADNKEFNLYTEFWCLEDYTDAEYIYPEADNDFPDDDEEYMGSPQQFPRRSLSFYMYQPVNGLVNYNNYQAQLKFYGKTRLEVYSIDDNYLNYLYKSEGYLSGGVQGGIGVFGSKCGKMLYTRVVKHD